MKIFVNEESCLDAMKTAVLNRRKAMLLEFSVGLAIFTGEGKSDMHAKKALRILYADVGYDCRERSGEDYTRVDHRIGAMAMLFEKIGSGGVLAWTKRYKNTNAIERIAAELEKLGLFTVRDVQNYCRDGEKVAKPKVQKQYSLDEEKVVSIPLRRRASDVEPEGTRHVDTESIHIAIPPEVDPGELMSVAQQLIALAAELTKKAA